MKFRIPIWIKLFTVTVLILLLAMIPAAITNYSKIKRESVDREWQIVTTQSESKAEEVRLTLANVIDKALISATYLMTQKMNEGKDANPLLNPFTRDPDMLSIEILKVTSLGQELILRSTKEDAVKEYQLHPQYFHYLRERQKFPIDSVLSGKIEILNSTNFVPTTNKNFAIATIGLPFTKDANGRIEQVILIDVLLSSLQKQFNLSSESTAYLTDSRGILLAHQDSELAMQRKSFAQAPLVAHAIENSKQPQYQSKFEASKEEFIGSYVRTSYGPIVVFQSPMREILAPAESVKKEFIKNLSYAIFAAIFFISLFSITLTRPIERLASLIKLVAKGDFEVSARSQVKSNDEVGDLAVAFDQMTDGLKERDKVKSLFSKFHGSSVADDIINSEMSLGGQNKEVVVFFSDIRGFTAFSENKSPEEVVEMLNEYFGIMVGIITRYGGVVDKFIGDAIMAVWGAPKSSESDASNALRACIEMRIQLNILNESRAERGLGPIQIGMGLHAGEAISGTIGSSERMEYTVIGNTVNTASRIEASTKAFGVDLLITEDVISKLDRQFKTETVGSAEVKGRTDAIRMFKVKGYFDEVTNDFIEIVTPYSEYEKGDVDKIKVSA